MYKIFRDKVKVLLKEEQKNIVRSIFALMRLAYQDMRVNMLGQVFPMKPISVSMMANDICNSRCQMCLIWQQKKDKEILPSELEKLLNDPFFSNVQHIGVTGGEPTLRKDLPELFRAICSRKPKISGTSMITNAIIEDVVKERVLACAEICQHYGVSFSVMVSLDGLGEIHDTVRGRKNNFTSAINAINYFRQQGIPTSFGCTITKSNALYVDELLDYAKSEGLYGRFRVAEFIDRLYNNELVEYIRNFDDKTAYHLGLFFFRLEHDFEKNPTHQKTYRSIRGMLAEAKPRQTGCPYQTRSVILTARGDLLYCSPKSPILGNALELSPGKIYFSNLSKRRKMIKKDCDNCIHDYHVPINFREKTLFWIESKRRNKKYNCFSLIQQSKRIVKNRNNTLDLSLVNSKKILIVGWYGTETAGDKAILWAIINRLHSRLLPPEEIYLASLYPFVSQWTVQEMTLGKITIVETFSREFERICDQVDEIIIGGGPLMDIKALNHMLYAFIRGAKSGALIRVEGCGIGPLISPLYTEVVAEIFRLSDLITLRDQSSTDRCIKEFSVNKVETVRDPATEYVESVKSKEEILKDAVPILGRVRNVSCFLREWGTDYAGSLNKEDYKSIKENFEIQIAQLIAFVAQSKSIDVHFLPMHTFHIGNDDRVFNRRLAKEVRTLLEEKEPESRVRFARVPVSPLEILQSMYHADFNICMRFHSVLFAETLGIPYLAIDYTEGGKIKAFLEEKGKLDRLISLHDVATGQWKNYLMNLLYAQDS